MRPKLQRLLEQIANSPQDNTMAYHDDVNIISSNAQLLENIIAAYDIGKSYQNDFHCFLCVHIKQNTI
jgi:hypothetical protein